MHISHKCLNYSGNWYCELIGIPPNLAFGLVCLRRPITPVAGVTCLVLSLQSHTKVLHARYSFFCDNILGSQ